MDGGTNQSSDSDEARQRESREERVTNFDSQLAVPSQHVALVDDSHSPEELERRAVVWSNAMMAEHETRGQDPYEYRPRRSVRVGSDYQAVLPPRPSDTQAQRVAKREDVEPHRFGHARPMTVVHLQPVQKEHPGEDNAGSSGDDDGIHITEVGDLQQRDD